MQLPNIVRDDGQPPVSRGVRPGSRNLLISFVLIWYGAAFSLSSPVLAQVPQSPSEQRDQSLREAIQMLESIGDASTEDKREAQQRRVDEAIGRFQDAGRDGIPILRESLERGHTNPAFLIVAASLLILAEGPSAVDTTVRALGSIHPKLYPELYYRWLHVALRSQPKDPSRIIDRALDVPPMSIRLSEFENEVFSPSLIGYALAAGGPSVTRRLFELVGQGRKLPEEKWKNLMTALSHLPSPEAARAIEKVLPSLDGEYKRAAVWTLGKMDDEKSVHLLIRLYGTEKDIVVRREIIFALGEMCHAASFPLLERALKDPSEAVRSYAVSSIVAVRMPESGPLLAREFLSEKSSIVRPDFVTGLLELRPPGYRELIDAGKRKWPSFGPYIDERLKHHVAGPPAGPPLLMPELAGQVLDPANWKQLLVELEDSRGLSLPLNRKTVVLSASEADANYLKSLLPDMAGILALDHYKAYETYQEVYRLIRRKWRKDPRPMFSLPPQWYGMNTR